MTKFWNDYHLPTSLQEALDLLARYNGRARVVAGGTDLLLDFQDAYHSGERPCFDALVDVTRLQGAQALCEEDGWIVIGCGVTHAQLVASPLVQARATALAEACAVVGGPQVRNVATLVGNVAHALPAADGTIALMALGAEAQVARCNEPIDQLANVPNIMHSWQPLLTLFKGPGISAVDPTRGLIAAIRVRPTGQGEGSAFTRVMRPQGVALPILGMAARIKAKGKKLKAKSEDQIAEFEDVSISAGPVAPVPFRATKTEEFLRGKMLSDETLAQATQVLMSEVSPRTSPHRATKEYRYELLPALLREVLTKAVERSTGNEPIDQ
jgi:carbon-monoxide dehydrogenase medium subunit